MDAQTIREAQILGRKTAETGHVVLAVVALLKAARENGAYELVPVESIDDVTECLYEGGW